MRCNFLFGMLALLLICPALGFAQAATLRFNHISGEQGLSNSTIECIFQDDRGFIWFGTRDGLNRFDGNHMVVYRYNAADSNSISDNYIRCISQDRSGVIWVGTSNGLNRFDPKTGRFTRFKCSPHNLSSISHNLVTSICESKTGELWIGTWSGLNLYLPQKNVFLRVYAREILTAPENQLHCVYQDPAGRLWVGSEKGLFYLDNKTRRLVLQNRFEPGRSPAAIRIIHAGDSGRLWIGTGADGLYAFHPEKNLWKHYYHIDKDPSSLGSNLVRSIEVDKQGQLWVGTVNGGLNLLLKDGIFQHFQNEPANPASLSQRTVSALLADRQGNLWIGTHRGGVNLYVPKQQNFGLFQKEPDPNSLSYNDVKCFFEDRAGKIWIGTDGGGLNVFDPDTKQFHHYRYNPYHAKSLGSDAVLHVLEDSYGNLWVSTWGGGLNLVDRKTGSFTRFLHNPAAPGSISSNFVQQVFEDDQRRLWVATYYGGLNLFDRNTNTFRRVESDEQHLTHLMGNNFISICQDKKGNLWFGTDDGGLNCLERQTQKFINYFVNEEKMPDLRVLFVDSKGRLWAGQAGLYLFNEEKRSFALYTSEGGLSNEFIKGICEDQEGYFWIATSNGLTRFHPERKSIKKFNTADGLQGLEFEANAYLRSRSGQLFFGGVNGFNMFHPKDIQPDPFVPPVYVTGFQVSNEKITPANDPAILANDISYTKKIKLSYKQSTFSFEFAALNFSVPENNQYAYRLRGLNDEWNYAGNEQKATYTNLPPGTYTFEVKASNNDGVWNEAPTAITVIITPPFWNTWWFKILVAAVLLAAASAFLILKRRLELQKLEESKRVEMHRMQLQFFTNISHEFRTPLSLILGPLEILQKEEAASRFQHHYQTIHRNASRLLGLVNELMDFRKAEAGVLKLKVMPGNLKLFLAEIADEFTGLAEAKNIDFSVQVTDKLPSLWFDRQVLEKILMNLISNAFKYTANGGKITVKATKTLDTLPPSFQNELILKNSYQGKEYIFIQVSDNGIGISKDSIKHLFERFYKITDSHLGSGIGLAFVKSLTFLHKGSISVYSERLKGTEFIVALPVSEDDYTNNEKWMQNKKEPVTHIESLDYKYEGPLLTPQEERKKEKGTEPAKHLLIVDDNEELRQFLRETLSADFHVWEAEDGQRGLLMAKEKSPDLIISDVMMPVMDGTEFCKKVKEDAQTKHIPFIMLTAKAALRSKIEGVGSGADLYFSKPLNTDLMLLTIRNIFQHQESIKEHCSKDLHHETKALVHAAREKDFIEQLLAVVEEQLSNPELDVEYICRQMGMSRTKLHQMIKNITGQSISDFVRTVRLRKAVQIMTEEDVLITEVMYRVGMQTQSYFTKAFKKEYGKTPSQYLQELKK
ncbi:hybrid sensor histidine kinase/response regulator transcription factor [Longitalea arenae]|uniref:hybrid sensor histidine kinase/response regulator transcription factor n=1 Tax=Longitalea arenae TaxID=2812558 RepID=UPI0019677752|nr:two-component regulator propeller domain-containing protein [Longitalea arenae]